VTPFEIMQRHYQQRDLAAREWQRNGGKVVGYLCDNVPEELITAAGFLPLRLSGDPEGGTETVGEYWDEGLVFFREGFVASMLYRILHGAYDFLDYLVIPHARDSVHRLYTALLREQREQPQRRLPELAYLDSLHTTFFRTGIYNRAREIELQQTLERWSGRGMTREALQQAVALSNESRRLLKQLAALRAADPPRVTGVEALQIIGSSMFMPRQQHNELLAGFLGGADAGAAHGGIRLYVVGSPMDNLQFYELVESCGATVVGEDNCWGNRWSDVPIDPALEPLEGIIDRYARKSPCPRMYPLRRRIDYCLGNALQCRA
jgi:benzoyl-CoA reductase/2-hydroxyglutaryl-CoA dehydratase subunit BcrC/BadD/HgdB